MTVPTLPKGASSTDFSNLGPSIIRILTAQVVGAAAAAGLLTTLNLTAAQVTPWVALGVGVLLQASYYSAVRILESRFPVLGHLLLIAQAPTYTPAPAQALPAGRAAVTTGPPPPPAPPAAPATTVLPTTSPSGGGVVVDPLPTVPYGVASGGVNTAAATTVVVPATTATNTVPAPSPWSGFGNAAAATAPPAVQ